MDERTGETHDFRKRKAGEEIVRAVTVAPAGAPAWASDPQALWNRVEASENRKDAQVARDYRVPIPLGLTDDQAGDLAVDLAEFIRDALGVPVSVGLHRDADRDALGQVKPDDLQGFHAHLYFPTRPLALAAGSGAGEGTGDTGHGFGPKLAMLSNKRQSAEWVEAFNEKWAELSNDYLHAAGLRQVFDHRSYTRQGVDAVPQPKMGVAATAMERKGISTARGDVLREALAMAEVHRKVRVATAAALNAGAPPTPVAPAGATGTGYRISVPITLPGPVRVSRKPERRQLAASIEPRVVVARPRRAVRTGAPGLKDTLAQRVAAAGGGARSEADQAAIERAVELASHLDSVLQTFAAQLKEHDHLVEQARRAQQHALELAQRIEDSRRKRERARQAVRDLTNMHPVRIRLSKAGLPVNDPRQAKLAQAAFHDRHVQEDKRAHRSLRVTEGVAWDEVKAARAELDQQRVNLQAVVADLAAKDLPALTQLLGFLPDGPAGWVREALEASASRETGGLPMSDGGPSGSETPVMPDSTLAPRPPIPRV